MGTFGRRLPGTIVRPQPLSEAPHDTQQQRKRQVGPSLAASIEVGQEGAAQPPAHSLPSGDQRPSSQALSGNAFVTLGIPIDASHDRISQAVDDLAFDEDRDEAALQAARASLFSARDRLAQEIVWLPECTAEQQLTAISAVLRSDSGTLATLANTTSGLARINLLEAGAELRATDVQPALQLIEAITQWQPERTLDAIDEARGRGGFRPVDVDQWEQAVARRLGEIAARLAPLFAGSPDGRARLTGLMHRKPEPGSALATFIEALQSAYAAAIEESLGRLEMRIQTTVKLLGVDPANTMQINSLIAALNQWSAYRRPIQIMESARSLDDRESARIFDAVLSLAINVSNEHKLHTVALLIAQALLDSFAHLPQQRARLERQMPILHGNLAIHRLEELGSRIKKQHHLFASQVKSARMQPRSKGLAGELLELFESARASVGEDASTIFTVVREIIISAHNSSRDKKSTQILLKWLLGEHPPAEIRKRLEDDLRTLSKLQRRSKALLVMVVMLWVVAKCAGHHRPESGASSDASQATTFQEQQAAQVRDSERAQALARLREQARQSSLDAERIRAANDALRSRDLHVDTRVDPGTAAQTAGWGQSSDTFQSSDTSRSVRDHEAQSDWGPGSE